MTAIAIKPAGRPRPAAPPIGLGQLIGNRKVLGLFLIRVFTGPITTFYWTWLPLYLRGPGARHVVSRARILRVACRT